MRNYYNSIFMLSLVCLLGCSNKVSEIERISSPNSDIDAVVVEKQVDATAATPTEIYIVPRGEAVKGQPVFRADKIENLKVEWRGDSQVLISADAARTFLEKEETVVNLPGCKKIVTLELNISGK